MAASCCSTTSHTGGIAREAGGSRNISQAGQAGSGTEGTRGGLDPIAWVADGAGCHVGLTTLDAVGDNWTFLTIGSHQNIT